MIIKVLANGCFAVAFVVFALGILGLFKFPDPYTRMHALGMGDSLGAGLVGLGLFILSDSWILRVKLIVILLLFFAINTTMTHLIAKAGLLHGTKPVENTEFK